MSKTKVIPLAEPKEAQTIVFPIYRKYKTGREWQMIASPSTAVHVTQSGTWWNITIETANKDLIAGALQDTEAEQCSRDEWEKVYGHAQWTLTQINGVHSHKVVPPSSEVNADSQHEYTIKKSRYNPLNGQWELIRLITANAETADKIIRQPCQPVPLAYTYAISDHTGAQVAQISSANPSLFD